MQETSISRIYKVDTIVPIFGASDILQYPRSKETVFVLSCD